MRFLRDLQKTLGFTPQEGRVVLFLIATFLAGMGIKLVRSAGRPPGSFDYAASDSEFEARSRAFAEADTGADSSAAATPEARKAGSPVHLSLRSININTATKEELIRLPGIGEAMARRILLYRDENGSFSSVEELGNVRGIGQKKLERIAPYCTLGR